MKVRADLNVSLDGFGSTVDGTPVPSQGDDWWRLVDAYSATRTFRERVLGDTSGAGTTGVDDKYWAPYFEDVGAEIMGAGMFGLDLHPNDPDWHGWWGPNPPFHVPTFVLTHETRPVLEMEGGTVFHFVSATPQEALDLAAAEAGGLDIRIGGGPTIVREFLKARLVDELHVAIAPILLGRGVRLWDELRGLESGYRITAEGAESGTAHVTFTRRATGEDAPGGQPWRPPGNTL